ncbi:MAG: RrF2 family transcriptional regulator [Inhella sp.]|jgi:Rrf2 family iron-sulfur cluster assembly transcriptional regulator|uniref:RrF2 family transcriptional regulator n=1 Tax=Inhella sp. TaxID=1921806 RepID=UPI0022BBDF2B|nr:Rrf2 family transcriptional regulator [Inhella sp.]MCZ8236612.1 Rrf2 family transcriptional regulator [Inhella sp.]
MPNRRLSVAVSALVELAETRCGQPLALTALAPRLGVSLSYLEAVFGKLRGADLVDSLRGPGGGYLLARSPHDLSIAEVARAVGQHTLTGAREAPEDDEPTSIEQTATGALLDGLEAEALRWLETRTLADCLPPRTSTPRPEREAVHHPAATLA